MEIEPEGTPSAPASVPVLPRPLPPLPVIKKGWAQGARKTFLQSQEAGYQFASLQSQSRASDYCDSVVNRYFTTFHWTLPIDQEPSADFSFPDDKELTPEEKVRKGEIISQMKKVFLLT